MARHLHAVAESHPDYDDLHAMPHDPDAERAVIGAAILGGPAMLAEISDLIGPEDMYVPAHETILAVLFALADRGSPTDVVAAANALGPELAKVGGHVYLHTCIEAVPTAANGPYYAQIVKDKAYSRALVSLGIRLAQMGRTEFEDDLKAAAEREIMTVLSRPPRGWNVPIPLVGSGRAVAPAFPLSALPSWTRAKVEAVAHDTQTPPDLAASLALACISTAAGGRVSVLVRPEIGWREPVNLYMVAALAPGSRKSPVFSNLTAPITAAEGELVEQLLPEITTLRVDKKAAEDAAARAADQLAKANAAERDGARFEAHEAALAAEAITVPAIPRLFVDDVTPEALASILAEQGGSLAILSAESEVFNVIAGRYSGSPNMNVFLKGHAGDALRVDRRGRPPETIEHPALTLGICTQPAALSDLAAIPGAAGRGLLARFLFTVPDVAIGRRATDPEPADPAAHAAWSIKLRALLLTLRELPAPVTLALSPEADKLRRAASEDFEAMMADGAELAGLRDWGSKAVGAMVRIAGLLYLAEHLDDGFLRPISVETMAQASTLIEYYTDHALIAFGLMTTEEATAPALAVLDWIERTGPARFTARDAYRGLPRTKFPKMADLDPALNLLEQHGHIRRVPAAPTVGRGRPPAPEYETNPYAIE
ncbi:DUF3987 domain-containing protein [Actinospica durhamensis]|uniref:DUF3987 domain-containing protein n=1 Tax=Actinospica durhamensis TaxID=1508375 RepID=A0A941IV25_9ACTN|nr:DUF3987 domain-containing protein [Actinospica durhamensis]MBR7838438.1 DUF3987 domain-containing protein [Actinospica durhamensis]